jgi:hypothetical protein
MDDSLEEFGVAEEEFDRNIRIPSILPEQDRAEARQLLHNVWALYGFVKCFENALSLFDYALSEFTSISNNYNKMGPHEQHFLFYKTMHTRWQMMSWTRIACRDGALQIFHFAKIMQVIRGTLCRAPSLLKQTDIDKLKIATRLMDSQFPHWKLIRDAVAHSPQEFMPSVAYQISQGSKPFTVGDLISGREYIIVKDKIYATYAVSQESLEKLRRIRTMFMSGVADLLERAVNAPQWPPVAQPSSGQNTHQS